MQQSTQLPTEVNSRFERCFNLLGFTLLVLALPSLLQSAYEVYLGTLLDGPQMIGFALAHADPDSAFVRTIRYSSYALVLFNVYGLVVLSRVVAKWTDNSHQRFFIWCFIGLSLHRLIVALYPYWSNFFDQG